MQHTESIFYCQRSALVNYELNHYFIHADNNRVQPLVLDVKEDLIVLPLSAGQQYQLFTVATDNVGNQQSLSEAMANMMIADYPLIIGVCPNNCSNRGNCTELNSCRCDTGFYGSDCSQSKYDNGRSR